MRTPKPPSFDGLHLHYAPHSSKPVLCRAARWFVHKLLLVCAQTFAMACNMVQLGLAGSNLYAVEQHKVTDLFARQHVAVSSMPPLRCPNAMQETLQHGQPQIQSSKRLTACIGIGKL